MQADVFSTRLLANLVTPTFVLDAESKVIIWNKALERLTGMPAADLLGTNNHWQAFYPEPRPCLADLVASGDMSRIESLYAISNDPNAFGVYAENWVVMPRTGIHHYVSINAGLIHNNEGRVIAVAETLSDLTLMKRTQMELERLAGKDGLTGLANRRTMDDVLSREWKRLSRERAQIAFLLIDIDCFKRFNDAFGHQAGDACLVRVAETIGAAVRRPSDLAARYGGEEFAVILPGTDLSGALIVAKRICAAIQALSILHPNSEVGPHVTASIGVAATVPFWGRECHGLIASTDAALYRAKAAGRNRVEFG